MEFTNIQMINVLLLVVILFVVFKYLETFWSYKISKPYLWERAVKARTLNKRLVKMERTFRDRVRFYNLWFQVERLKKNKIQGAFAELGVHKGQTAKAIHLMDDQRTFYLFDTFEGFPDRDLEFESQKDSRFSNEMFADTTQEDVEVFIGGNDNLQFRKGYFPDTTKGLESETFALVHIDADLYEPTKSALNFFYPHLSSGGVMIIHDYNHNWEGVPKAIDEFLQQIPESLTVLPDWQGSAMIIKNSN
ncbi:MAG: class I SAM-dependent methyltransferase [Cyclobacteriaceae bacterium]